MHRPPPPVVFCTAAYEYLRAAVCDAGQFEAGEVERQVFPDGERYLRIRSNVSERHAVLIGGTIGDADTLELYDLATGLVQEGAERLALVIPFFGCSTMERAVKTGEVVTAKTRARLLSSIPIAGDGNRVFLVDLHAEGIAHYFEGALRPVHVWAQPVVMEACRRLGGDDFIIACTDAGRAKWVQGLANALGVTASFVFKRRTSGSETEITAVSAQVEGRRVVIYDDMIRTGGSLIGAARAYLDAGATEIAAVATHAVLPADSLAKIRQSGLLKRIAVTDTHPRALALAGDFLTVDSVAPLLAERIAQGR